MGQSEIEEGIAKWSEARETAVGANPDEAGSSANRRYGRKRAEIKAEIGTNW